MCASRSQPEPSPHPPTTDEAGLAVHRACEQLRQLVAQGRLVGGQPVIEADVCRELGIARGTVRESLRMLQSEGLLVARARGLQVRRLSRRDVDDLFELRELLEAHAAQRAAQRHSQASRAQLQQLQSQLAQWQRIASDNTVGAFSQANRSFHDLVIELSGNVHLPRLLDQALMVLFASQFRAWVPPAQAAIAAQDHVRIAQAIASGDGAAASRAMRAHVQRSRQAIGALPDAAFAAEAS